MEGSREDLGDWLASRWSVFTVLENHHVPFDLYPRDFHLKPRGRSRALEHSRHE